MEEYGSHVNSPTFTKNNITIERSLQKYHPSMTLPNRCIQSKTIISNSLTHSENIYELLTLVPSSVLTTGRYPILSKIRPGPAFRADASVG